jgi:hypothetical protein
MASQISFRTPGGIRTALGHAMIERALDRLVLETFARLFSAAAFLLRRLRKASC